MEGRSLGTQEESRLALSYFVEKFGHAQVRLQLRDAPEESPPIKTKVEFHGVDGIVCQINDMMHFVPHSNIKCMWIEPGMDVIPPVGGWKDDGPRTMQPVSERHQRRSPRRNHQG